MLTCIKCWDVFYSGIRKRNPHQEMIVETIPGESIIYCPKITCKGKLVEIDENILPIILTLHKKGYETEYSCSSHTISTYPYYSPYISFAKDYKFDSLPESFSLRIKCLEMNIKRLEVEEGVSYSVVQALLFEALQSLLVWAEGLPDAELKEESK